MVYDLETHEDKINRIIAENFGRVQCVQHETKCECGTTNFWAKSPTREDHIQEAWEKHLKEIFGSVIVGKSRPPQKFSDDLHPVQFEGNPKMESYHDLHIHVTYCPLESAKFEADADLLSEGEKYRIRKIAAELVKIQNNKNNIKKAIKGKLEVDSRAYLSACKPVYEIHHESDMSLNLMTTLLQKFHYTRDEIGRLSTDYLFHVEKPHLRKLI